MGPIQSSVNQAFHSLGQLGVLLRIKKDAGEIKEGIKNYTPSKLDEQLMAEQNLTESQKWRNKLRENLLKAKEVEADRNGTWVGELTTNQRLARELQASQTAMNNLDILGSSQVAQQLQFDYFRKQLGEVE